MDSERMIMVPDWLVEEAASLIEQAGLSGIGVSLAAPRLRAALVQPAAGEPVEAKEIGEMTITLRDGVKCFSFEEYSEAYKLPEGLHYLYAAPPAAAHGDEAVRVDARLLELYQAPFRFDERGGYIWDAQNNMVADNHVEGDQAMRVRGWGRLSYRQDGEEVQDLMGQAMADALTARWNAAMRAQGDGG